MTRFTTEGPGVVERPAMEGRAGLSDRGLGLAMDGGEGLSKS